MVVEQMERVFPGGKMPALYGRRDARRYNGGLVAPFLNRVTRATSPAGSRRAHGFGKVRAR